VAQSDSLQFSGLRHIAAAPQRSGSLPFDNISTIYRDQRHITFRDPKKNHARGPKLRLKGAVIDAVYRRRRF
jgi:hypothetical protein